MLENFSKIIKDLRTQYDISQEDLARQLNTSVSTVSRWERGASVIPSTKTLIDICVLFNISLNDLLGIAKEKVIVIDMLTVEQQKLLETLVIEFRDKKHSSTSLSHRQSEIIQMLFSEFMMRGDKVD